jgi:hypothetical protein
LSRARRSGIARRLKEKGIFTDDEIGALLADFERKGPAL